MGIVGGRPATDRLRFRRALNRNGVGPVAAVRVTGYSSIDDFVRRHGPAVLKPVSGDSGTGDSDSSGTGTGTGTGVRIVRDRFQVRAAWAWLTGLTGLDAYLIEELLSGVELSVDTLSRHGAHEIVAITGPPLSPAVRDEVAAFTIRVLDATGVIDGPAHTRVVLTEHGPRAVEPVRSALPAGSQA
jgi:hypothetical protein